ncbi:MAG TPA: ABC transporter permease [Candidatus Acidoferrales bacterium]|nr:ABC transporter permease [Candidatus Acidoferrales bacterium]
MNMSILRRIANLFHRSKLDQDIDAELRAHIEMRTADNIATGMSPEEARRQAVLRFGSRPAMKERAIEADAHMFLDSLWQDVRYALRMLRKSPGFTAVAVLTLALGIGANTAIFSVVDAVLLRPLPYPDSDRLMMAYQAAPQLGQAGPSYPNFQDWQRVAGSFEELVAFRTSQFALSGTAEATNVIAGAVTSGYFPMFRVKPILGRTFEPGDDVFGTAGVAVLSERLWRSQFGADPAIIGKTIQLEQRPFTVIGIVPGSFRPQIPDSRALLWVPLLQDSIAQQLYKRRGGHYLNAAGRLKQGVTREQAQSELESIQEALQRQYPDANKGWGARIIPLQEDLSGSFRTALLVLLGAVALVFLVACANVASLQMVRATARQREVAIRSALGAGRGRLFQQFLTECLLTGVAGGAAGLVAAYATVKGFVSWLPADLPRIDEIQVNGAVLAFGLVLAIVAGIVLGLAPAWSPSGRGFADALKEGGRGGGEGTGRRTLRSAFVVTEMALAVVLLVGAGLLIRSFERLANLNPGFNASHLLTAGVSLDYSQYTSPQKLIGFYNETLNRMNAVPGAQGAAIVVPRPLADGYINLGFQIDGRPQLPESKQPEANLVMVSPNYFHVAQIPLLSGRELSDMDSQSAPKVCVISKTAARSAFGNENPIGQRITIGYPESVTREIVGIVGDVKDISLASSRWGQVYVPFVQNPLGGLGVAIRASGDTTQISSAVRSGFHAIDPALPVEIDPLSAVIGESVTEPRFRTTLLALFAGVALLLAAIGIYGIISYNTSLRTREIGIRMALGAQRSDVLRLIVTQVFLLAATSVALGIAASFGVARFLRSLLFQISAMDAMTYAVVGAVMILVALLACYIPARRAMRVDPLVALRHE